MTDVAAPLTTAAPAPVSAPAAPHGLGAYIACFRGIVWREVMRFLHQRERFLSALVRPLIWLFIFAAGFRQVLGISIIPPYQSYVLYETYVTPGLVGMILLFNAMQSSLSMVYDRETGAMRTLLVSPFPRSFLLLSKLIGGVAVAMLQAYAFLAIAYYWEIGPGLFSLDVPLLTAMTGWSIPEPFSGYITVAPALFAGGLMLGALALFMSSVIRQLENFAGVMNFVIFPMFFASSALYPLWRIKESSPILYEICRLNPFTYVVELIRFAYHGELNHTALAVVVGCTVAFLSAAIYAYNPSKGLIGRRGGPGG
jgi:ABC-2 type transport system permease protein